MRKDAERRKAAEPEMLSQSRGGAEKNGLIKCRIPNVRLRDN